MRNLSWVGGGLLIVAVSVAAFTAQKLGATDDASLTASRPVLAADSGSQSSVYDRFPQREYPAPRAVQPAPSPKPKPVAVAPAPKKTVTPVVHHTTAPAPVAIVSAQQALINKDRAAAGLPPLRWSSCLASVARSNAARIAKQGYLSHTNGPSVDLGCHLGNHAGENIGYWSGGIDDVKLNSMFMASPEHRANIMGRYYHYVGTAWVVAPNGTAYIAVEFS